MRDNKNNGLYSPSLFSKSGYTQKQSYNMEFAPQNGVHYNFDYYNNLRRKLNYLFEYVVFPKYGRYTFVYDISDLITIENPVVFLKRDIKDIILTNDELSSTQQTIDSLILNGNVNSYIEKHMDEYIVSLVQQSILNNLENIERTIDSFIDYSKIVNSYSKDRRTSLFSDSSFVLGRNNIKNGIVEKDTIYDFSIDRAIDLATKIIIDNNIAFTRDIMTSNRDTITVQDYLKKDYKLQKIVEDLYISKLIEMHMAKDTKNIAMYENLSFISKDGKDISSIETINGMHKDYKDITIVSDIAITSSIPKETIVESVDTIDVYKDVKDIHKVGDFHLNIEKEYKDAEIENTDIKSYFKKKVKSAIDEEINKNELQDIAKEDFEGNTLKSHEKFLVQAPQENFETHALDNNKAFLKKNPTKDIPYAKPDDIQSFTFVEKHGEDNIVVNKDNHDFKRTGDFGVSTDISDSENVLDRQAKFGVGLVDNSKNNKSISRASGRNIKKEESKVLNKDVKGKLRKDNSSNLSKSRMDKKIDNHDVDNALRKDASKELEKEFEKQLNLHKRFWFVKSLGKIDYKILPNKDFEYPVDINIFSEKPNFIYSFNYDTEYKDIKSDKMIIELYNYQYNRIDTLEIPIIQKGTYGNSNITVQIDTFINKAKFDIKIKHDNLYYIIIRQPKDVDGCPVLYTVTSRFLGDNKHPIPFGNDLGTREIAVHINVMVDFINIMMLMWSKFYYQFTGYTGIQAIYGIINLVHEWVTLETSLEHNNIEEFHRCFRWLRWEGEKLYNIAKNDPNLTGNAWVEELIFQLIEYMEMHHMNELPEFNPTHLMDEYRNIFDDPSFDIDIIIDKVKGIRKRAIDTNKISRNKK